MGKRVLITGGAGFIGSHLADHLLSRGHQVRALDNLSPQVHDSSFQRPSYLNDEVELVIGDVRDPDVLRRALRGVDVVYHFAALVGVGQSMYEMARYTDVNNLGTAMLLECILERPVERLIVASSMSVYGEGLYRRRDGSVLAGHERSLEQLRASDWELRDEAGEALEPLPTPESKATSLSSVYALSKYDQERMCMLVGRAYNIPTVAMRFFNTYGPRQALSNPYTGVLAIFASRVLNNKRPLVNEDGFQKRDLVCVHDVAEACALALEVPEAAGKIFNVGSGQAYTIREVAARVAKAIDKPQLQPEITQKYRVGDIRHCFPDISLAREVLGYEPSYSLDRGLLDLAIWLDGKIAVDRVESARAELDRRGLSL